MTDSVSRLLDDVAETGDISVLRSKILGNNIDIDILVENTSLLGFVAEFGCLELTEKLISQGADINFCIKDDPDFLTPLMAGVLGNNLDVVKALVVAGADVNYVQQAGDYALMFAARNGNQDIFDYLKSFSSPKLLKPAKEELKEVAKIKKREQKQSKSEKKFFEKIMEVMWNGDLDYREAIVSIKKNIDNGVNVNTLNERNETPLMRIIGSSYTEITDLLLKSGADPNLCLEGMPPLIKAASYGNIEDVKKLIKYGADVNIRIKEEPKLKEGRNREEDYDRTALMMAVIHTPNNREYQKYYEDTVKALIEAKADLELCDRYNYTALMLAIYYKRKNLEKILLDAGASEKNLHIAEFHQAILDSNLEKVRANIISGIEINSKNPRGETALFTSIRNSLKNQNIQISKILLAAGADVDLASPDDTTPLIEAICKGQRESEEQIELIEMLILAGANTELKDNSGYNAIDHLKYSALSKKNRQIIIRTINQHQK